MHIGAGKALIAAGSAALAAIALRRLLFSEPTAPKPASSELASSKRPSPKSPPSSPGAPAWYIAPSLVFHGVFKRTEILACQSGAVPTMATATAIAVNAVVFRLKPALAASEALFCHGKMGPPFSQGVARKKRARASLASHHQAHQRHERSADAIATAPQLIAKVVDQSRTQARASGIGIPGMGPL